jgi:hypothetical protein
MINTQILIKIRKLFLMLLVFCSTSASSEWLAIVDDNSSKNIIHQQYIDMTSIKQTGPMAIYRQVNILQQPSSQQKPAFASIVSLYEY